MISVVDELRDSVLKQCQIGPSKDKLTIATLPCYFFFNKTS